MDEITITKRISKLGENHIIIIPKYLRKQLQPKDVVQVSMKVLESAPKPPQTKSPNSRNSIQQKLEKIIGELRGNGYTDEQIKKVLVKNKYKAKDVKVALR